MHHIYTSESIILRREVQDTSAYFWVLTEGFGLIRARAQGIRRPASRLKGALQEYSLATVAFVRARNGWKITTAIPDQNFCLTAPGSVRIAIAHIADTLIRFITGEEHNKNIFLIMKNGCISLMKERTKENIATVESLMLIRILHILGYVALDDALDPLCFNVSDFSPPTIVQAYSLKKDIITKINKAFKESQL